MRRLSIQLGLGVIVLAAGVLLLLQAMGVLTPPSLAWAILLAAAGAAFWFVFFADRESWWAAIPGAALVGAAAAAIMGLDPVGLGQWTELPFLTLLSIGFWAVYLRDHHRWWAIIPAGMLLTTAVVATLAETGSSTAAGATFLFGAALTFALVALLPGGTSPRWWAWIPAGVLAVVAILVLASAAEWVVLLSYVGPVAVIGAGTYLIWRAVRRDRQEKSSTPAVAPDDTEARRRISA